MLAATIVDWNALGQVVLYSLVAGVCVPGIFAIAVHGAARATDPHRDVSRAAATFYVVMALVGAAICLAAVAYGIYLMTQK